MAAFSQAKHDAGPDMGDERGISIVAVGSRLIGEIQSNGVVKVEGRVAGTVRAEQQVLVARGGVVEGDIVAEEAIIGGEVEGSIVAGARVEIHGTAVVHGDITTERLIVQEGGEVNGHVHMGKPAMAGEEVTAQAAIAGR